MSEHNYTAQMWRDGSNLRGETFHLWLEEISAKSGMDLPHCRMFYEEIKETYRHENDISEDGMRNEDYVKLTARIEEAVATAEEYRQAHILKKQKRERSWFHRFLRFVRMI